MEKRVLIGGFGGQGVQTMGKFLGHAANRAGIITTFFPAYGGEMRGGTSNCTVTVSDRPIGAPNKSICDYVIAMKIPSFQRFERQIKPGGLFILNSDVILSEPTRKDISFVKVPVNTLADQVGSERSLNVIMLGFFSEYTGFVPTEYCRDYVDNILGEYKPKYKEINATAFQLGVDYAKKLKAENGGG